MRSRTALLLLTTALVATCGFVYQLLLIDLGSILLGTSTLQAAIVIAVNVSAMGVGALLSKKLLDRPAEALIALELLVALLGGFSTIGLYAAFAWLDLYQPAMIACCLLLGVMIGCELPLFARLIRGGDEMTGVADLLAADYLGAVLAGVGVPLLLLPWLGEIGTAFATGAVNAIAALLVWIAARSEMPRRARQISMAAILVVSGLLALGALAAKGWEVSARQALFDDPIVRSERSRVQDIVFTRSGNDLRLFLNGDLQFSSADEYRYHEMLVHPILRDSDRDVLILGGGDGLAAREVLKRPAARLTQVDLDAEMLAIARSWPPLRDLNADALNSQRVRVVVADAFTWLRRHTSLYDAVIVDFPDPDSPGLAKLYSQEMYTMIASRLKPGGRMVIQAGSPFFAPHAFWCVVKTAQASGFETVAYHTDVPSFGDWGFVAAQKRTKPQLRAPEVPLRYLNPEILGQATAFGSDRAGSRYLPRIEVSTLMNPRIVRYSSQGWDLY